MSYLREFRKYVLSARCWGINREDEKEKRECSKQKFLTGGSAIHRGIMETCQVCVRVTTLTLNGRNSWAGI